MKMKQQLISKVTITLDLEKEQDRLFASFRRKNGIKAYHGFDDWDDNDNLVTTLFVSLGDVPKIKRFIEEYKSKTK